MGKGNLPLKSVSRQTRLDAFFKPLAEPLAKRSRVETPTSHPIRSSPSRPASAPAWTAAAHTTILTSAPVSREGSVTSATAAVDSTSLVSSRASSAGSQMRRALSRSASATLCSTASCSSTASYCSSTSPQRAPQRRSATVGQGARNTRTKPPKTNTFFHDYSELLTPPPPAAARGATTPDIGGQRGSTTRWGELSVILPWMSRNAVIGQNGRSTPAWPLLLRILQEDVARNVNDLCELMQALLIHADEPHWTSLSTFRALATVVESFLTPQEKQEFFEEVLPYMRRTVMRGPRCFHSKRVAVLRQNTNKRVLLTRDEAFTLMCCSFFSLFPGRSASTLFDTATRRRFGVSPKLAAANFDCLFSIPMRNPQRWEAALNKIRCLLQYFFDASRSRRSRDTRCLEICRVSYSRFPDFANSASHLQPFELRLDGLIEEDNTALQVDFANRILGGGVLGQGCVQEEIRFVVSPELILSCLVAEPLLDHESVVVTGAQQHSYYKGYSDTFRYADATAAEKTNAATILSMPSPMRDKAGRRIPMPNISVVAMDAVDFFAVSKLPSDQYTPLWVERECNKAFVSFYGVPRDLTAAPKARRGPIATGNWGCGAFGGDVQLKLLIQWCSASEAGRPIHYYVFDRVDLAESFPPVYAKLVNEKWTVGDLYRVLHRYNLMLVNTRHANSAIGLTEGTEAPAEEGPKLFDFVLSTTLSDLRRK